MIGGKADCQFYSYELQKADFDKIITDWIILEQSVLTEHRGQD